MEKAGKQEGRKAAADNPRAQLGIRPAGTPQPEVQRKVLVILSNRLNRSQKPRFFEVLCQNDGTILSERRLPRPPRRPCYDEVWENDDGKTAISSCASFKRRYRHPLEKPRP